MLKTRARVRLAAVVAAAATTIGAFSAPLAAQEPAPPDSTSTTEVTTPGTTDTSPPPTTDTTAPPTTEASAPAAAVSLAEAAPAPRADKKPKRGQAAIDALGDRLPLVAARYDLTPGKLRKTLLEDAALWVDAGDALFYIDPIEEAAAAQASQAAPPVPLTDTFTLHSRSGAERTIYLDFTGDTISGTNWNTVYTGGAPFTATAFSLDGDGGSFSDAERTVIQSVWQRVSEDFAPFDIDVTTQEPGPGVIPRDNVGDSVYGTRVLFAGVGTAAWASICPTTPPSTSGACGGVAYLDAFDATGSDHAAKQPAFVFQQGVGGGAKNLAEAASHEVGHNLNLSHDGTTTNPNNPGYYTGHGSWAPIMGVGYSKPVVQWSIGEYALANNIQDDLGVMALNGALPVADLHGSSLDGSATPLVDGSASGVISTALDTDVFSFSTPGGLVSLSATPAPTSPNLDIAMTVFDSSGSTVVTVNPTVAGTGDVATGLDAAILEQTFAAGTYYVRIDGVGALNPASTGYSDYGSLGAYTLTGQFGVCPVDDDLDDDGSATTRLLIPGESTNGRRCADDDWIRFPGYNGASVTANLQAVDADLHLDILNAAGAQLATVAVPAGTTVPLVRVIAANADHFLRVRSTTGVESRYELTTSMPACPPLDQYEPGGNDDDFAQTASPMILPGTKDAISCSGDPNNGDFARIPGVAGREITATLRYPEGAGTVQLFMMRGSGQSIAFGTVVSPGQIEMRYTPTVTADHQLWVVWNSGAVPYRLTASQAAELAPTITNISPPSGEVGDTVTITGSGFGTVTAVSFANGGPGVTTPFTIGSPTSITTTVPAGAVDGPITVTNGAASAQSVPFSVTRRVIADFDGDGTTDRSVWRPGSGGWWVDGQATEYLGLEGDVPVPGDYDGDGTTERAVFRPSTGAWYVDGQPTEFLGLSTDIPVPGDYNGDGTTERAVFRPSTGAWYIDGQPTEFWGLSTDIPVPGDYNGDGTTERAVFRPEVGGWYVQGQAAVFHGLPGDVPVPGDYDGDGVTDIGIWRPPVGGWYIQGETTEFVGLSSDSPQPGDYDGDGITDRGIYRPEVGGWYVQGQATVFYGLSTDIPLVLPHAIHRTV